MIFSNRDTLIFSLTLNNFLYLIFLVIEEESDVDRQSSWEDTLNQGLEATKIAGEATSALGPADDYERGDMKDQTKNGTNKVSEDILRPLDEDDDDTFEDLL